MTNLPTVFLSYNPYSEVEQTLALRLHTIGAVHGYNMILPDRTFNSQVISLETKGRILISDFFILFSTESLSEVVQEEINIAFSKHKDKTKILVIYDTRTGRNLTGAENCTEVYIDTTEDALTIVTSIADKIKSLKAKTDESFLSTLSGILLIGVGLFALSEAFRVEPKKPRKKSIPKKKSPAKKKTTRKKLKKNV